MDSTHNKTLTNVTKESPNICVIGCGAIGGLITAHLVENLQKVQVIERGVQLAALQKNGLKLRAQNGNTKIHVRVSASANFDCEPQDIIFLAVKSHQIPQIAKQLPRIIHPNTTIITLQNGVPWWYFQRHGGEYEGQRLESVDPEGVISRYINPSMLVSCVSYPAAEVQSPGVVRHIEGNRFPVGEIDNSETGRARQISALLKRAGFNSHLVTDIRKEIWLKLWGVLAFNPVSMLTRATLEEICRNEHTRMLVTEMMREAEGIATQLGIRFKIPLEKRIAGAERVGPHKTSSLQDLEAGQPTELETILGAVIELGRLTKSPTPRINAIYASCKLLEKRLVPQDSGY